MTRLVVDASVAIKWFLDEPASPAARALLEGESELSAPDLLYAEIGSVLLKAVRRGAMTLRQASRSLALLQQIPVIPHPVATLASEALLLADRCRLGSYDAIYAALALKIGAQLLTADQGLVRALRGHGLGELVRPLGDPAGEA